MGNFMHYSYARIMYFITYVMENEEQYAHYEGKQRNDEMGGGLNNSTESKVRDICCHDIITV